MSLLHPSSLHFANRFLVMIEEDVLSSDAFATAQPDPAYLFPPCYCYAQITMIYEVQQYHIDLTCLNFV